VKAYLKIEIGQGNGEVTASREIEAGEADTVSLLELLLNASEAWEDAAPNSNLSISISPSEDE
jgi:hypothetical protein